MGNFMTDGVDPRPLDILGTTGLKRHGGFIDEEFMVRLRGRNAIRLYREMIDNSPSIAAALNAIKMLIRQVKWRVEPAIEGDAAAIAEAEDTEGALEDMSHTFGDFISETLSMIWAGYAPFEIVYKLRRGESADSSMRSKFDDGKFGWRKIDIRGQETLDQWVYDDEGGLEGFIQMDVHGSNSGTHGPVFIPIEKALLFRMETFKSNPEGKSLIRPAVIPYWYTKRIQEFEAIGIERNLAGMPIMEVPPELLVSGASKEHVATRQALEKFVTQVRMDERWGGLVPSETKPDGSQSGFKFKLMQSSGRKLVDTDVIIKRYRSEMLMLFMAQFLTMGTEKVGSFSLASNMTDLFGTALGTIMDSIADVINRFMIPRRQRLNGVSSDLDPKIVHGDIEGPELDKLASYISSLSSSGLIGPNPALERKLLEIGNLPQPPEEETEPVEVKLPEGATEAAGKPTAAEPTSEAAATVNPKEVMNGAQIKALSDILIQVSTRELPAESAIEVIESAFPISRERIKRMLDPIIKILKETEGDTPPVPPNGTPTAPPVPPTPPPVPGGEDEESEEAEDAE